MEKLGTKVPGGPSLPSAPADETGVTLGYGEGGGTGKRTFFFCEVRSFRLPLHQNQIAGIPTAFLWRRPPEQGLGLKCFPNINILAL